MFLNIHQSRWKSILFIFLVAGLTFANTFANSFINDDFDYIVKWPLIRDLRNLPRFFVGYHTPEGQDGIFSPLKTLTHALCFQFFGLNLIGYHTLALFIHLLGIYAVYQLTLVLLVNRRLAFFTGLLFALHPVHVESVSALTGSTDTLGIVFQLLSFYAFILYLNPAKSSLRLPDARAGLKRDEIKCPSNESPRYYVCSVVFGLLAMFTHELTLALPILLVFYDLGFSGRSDSWKVRIKRWFPFFAIALIYVGLKYANLGGISRGKYLMGSWGLTMLVVSLAWARYFTVLFFPVQLCHNPILSPGIFSFGQDDFYPEAVAKLSLFQPRVFLSLLLILGIISLAIRSYRRQPLVSFAIGWLFLTLLPASNIVPSSVYYAERYLYAGSWTFCLLLAAAGIWLYDKAAKKSVRHAKAIMALTILVFLFYSGRTMIRNHEFRNNVAAFRAEVRSNPQSALLKHTLGVSLMRAEEFTEALHYLKTAVAIKPENSHYRFSLAELYMGMGYLEKSEAELKRAIELNPDFAEAYYNLAVLYASLKQEKEFMRYLNKATEILREQGRILEAGDLISDLMIYWKVYKQGGSQVGNMQSYM